MLAGPRGRNRMVARRQLNAAVDALQGVIIAASGGNKPFKRSSGSSFKKPAAKKFKGTKYTVRGGKTTKVYGGRRSGRRTKKSLKSRVVALEKYTPKHSTHDYRQAVVFQALCAENECSYTESAGITATNMEQALTSLRFIDRGAPPAADEIDLSTVVGNNQKILFKDLMSCFTAKNNGHLAVDIRIYKFKCTGNTDTGVVLFMEADEDATLTGTTDASTSTLVYPSDFRLLRQAWQLMDTTSVRLNPGDETKAYANVKSRVYNPQVKDNDPLTPSYIKGDILWCIRVVGTISHGITDTTQIGLCDGGVDCHVLRQYKVKYQGDSVYDRIEILNSLNNMPGGAEQAGPNVVDLVDTV